MRSFVWIGIAGLLVATGCVPETKPPGAVAVVEPVRVVVDANAWKGDPPDLPSLLVTVHVKIQNHGAHPLRLEYDDFALLTANGARYSALAPHPILRDVQDVQDVEGSPTSAADATEPAAAWKPACAWPRFLPTQTMLGRALPAGVVEPGGSIAGFVYFQDVPGDKVPLLFAMPLVDAKSGAQFGEVRIPFVRTR
jgi:hypothetical protein